MQLLGEEFKRNQMLPDVPGNYLESPPRPDYLRLREAFLAEEAGRMMRSH
jgi:hypothetical protein